MTVRAIFFDYGGVVAKINLGKMHELERRYGIPENGMWETLFCTTDWDKVKVGRCREQTWLDNAEKRIRSMTARSIAGLKQEWMAAWRALDHNILALVRSLQGRYRVGMISNATIALDDELNEHHGIGHLFNPVVNSARVQLAKPDTRIYDLAAQQVGEDPSTCLHIDDLQPNIMGARAAGFLAVRYTGDFAALERSLLRLGIDSRPRH